MFNKFNVVIVENNDTLIDAYTIQQIKKQYVIPKLDVDNISLIKEDYFIEKMYIFQGCGCSIEEVSKIVKNLKTNKALLILNDVPKDLGLLNIGLVKSKEINKSSIFDYVNHLCLDYKIDGVDEKKLDALYSSIKKYIKGDNINLILSYFPIFLISDMSIKNMDLDEIKKYEMVLKSTSLLFDFLIERSFGVSYIELINFWMGLKESILINDLIFESFSNLIKAREDFSSINDYYFTLNYSKFKGVSDRSLMRFSFEFANCYSLIRERSVLGLQKLLNGLIIKK